MAWPFEAILILAALVGCWAACAAAEVGWAQRSISLGVAAAAVAGSLAAEVAALNGAALGGSVAGLGIVSLLLGGIALASLAVYLLSPAPEPVEEPGPKPMLGPDRNPDSEA